MAFFHVPPPLWEGGGPYHPAPHSLTTLSQPQCWQEGKLGGGWQLLPAWGARRWSMTNGDTVTARRTLPPTQWMWFDPRQGPGPRPARDGDRAPLPRGGLPAGPRRDPLRRKLPLRAGRDRRPSAIEVSHPCQGPLDERAEAHLLKCVVERTGKKISKKSEPIFLSLGGSTMNVPVVPEIILLPGVGYNGDFFLKHKIAFFKGF